MDIFANMKRIFGISQFDHDEEDYEDGYYEDSRYERPERRHFDVPESKKPDSHGKVLTMPMEREMKVVVISPLSYDDARAVCDDLKAFCPVIIKLDRVDRAEAQRIIDFVMGACYTLDGHVQEIKDDVFLVAPSMVDIQKDLGDVRSPKPGSFFTKFL